MHKFKILNKNSIQKWNKQFEMNKNSFRMEMIKEEEKKMMKSHVKSNKTPRERERMGAI